MGYVIFSRFSPSDYFLSPNFEKWFGGERIGSNDEIIALTKAHFEDLDKSHHMEGVKNLEIRGTKDMELKVDYFERYKFFRRKICVYLKKIRTH